MLMVVAAGALAQGKTEAPAPKASGHTQTLGGWRENRITVGSGSAIAKPSAPIVLTPSRSIRVSESVLSEVGTTVMGLYNIRTNVVKLRIGDGKKQRLNLAGNVGLKGWEAKAVGAFSKKPGTTFNLQYQYSFEDLIMNGMGHKLRLIKEF